MSACTVKLLYEIQSNVRNLIVYVAVTHSSRFDSRSACDLLDGFLTELINVEGKGFHTHSTKSEARHFVFRPRAGFGKYGRTL